MTAASGGFDAFFAYPTVEGEQSGLVFLGNRSREDWERVLGYAEMLRFHAGQILMRAGDIDRSLQIVAVGELEVLLAGPSGELRRLTTIPQGSVIGEIAFADGGARSATVRARTDGELARLSFDQYEALAARYPELGRAILLDVARILAARLRSTSEALATGAR